MGCWMQQPLQMTNRFLRSIYYDMYQSTLPPDLMSMKSLKRLYVGVPLLEEEADASVSFSMCIPSAVLSSLTNERPAFT